MKVLWSGEFFSNFSLAIVNRRLVKALLHRGNVDVAICTDPVSERNLPPAFQIFAERSRRDPRGADVTVVNALWPLRFGVPSSSRYVRILPWEYGSLPLEWSQELGDEYDDVWAPTHYNRDIFVNDGIPQDRTFVVPHGVDTRLFHPNGASFPTDRSQFHFLFVGATIPRKGIDVLVNAYLRAFSPADAVVLTIKDVNANTFYRGNTHGEQLRVLASTRGIARLAYVDETYDDEGVARLYRSVDCLVLPYRGEGFGMPVLEAMACGIPVIVTAGGATDDFVDEAVGWRVAAERRDCTPGSPVPTVGTAWLWEPDVDALARAMRFAYENREETKRRGAAAADRANGWTWDNAARITEERLATLLTRPARPWQRRDANYRDPLVYEEQRIGTSRIDGILLELFRRLGVENPTFFENEQAEIARTAVLATGMRWTLFERGGTEHKLDILSLSGSDAAGTWDALDSYRPRAVACAADVFEDLLPVASRLGYAHLVTETLRGDALFLRNDLIERAGFRLAPATEYANASVVVINSIDNVE
jgi:glycosyltransferase involved in cell wall biosynthesis